MSTNPSVSIGADNCLSLLVLVALDRPVQELTEGVGFSQAPTHPPIHSLLIMVALSWKEFGLNLQMFVVLIYF